MYFSCHHFFLILWKPPSFHVFALSFKFLQLSFCWKRSAAFSRDVTADCVVFRNKETMAMLVFQTNPLGIELYFYTNIIFYFKNSMVACHVSENALYQIKWYSKTRVWQSISRFARQALRSLWRELSVIFARGKLCSSTMTIKW